MISTPYCYQTHQTPFVGCYLEWHLPSPAGACLNQTSTKRSQIQGDQAGVGSGHWTLRIIYHSGGGVSAPQNASPMARR